MQRTPGTVPLRSQRSRAELFSERGEITPKGFEQAVRVYVGHEPKVRPLGQKQRSPRALIREDELTGSTETATSRWTGEDLSIRQQI